MAYYSYRMKMKNSELMIENLRSSVQELQKEITEVKIRRDELKNEKDSLTFERDNLRKQLKILQQEKVDVTHHMHEYYCTIADLEKKLEKNQLRFQEAKGLERDVRNEMWILEAGPLRLAQEQVADLKQ